MTISTNTSATTHTAYCQQALYPDVVKLQINYCICRSLFFISPLISQLVIILMVVLTRCPQQVHNKKKTDNRNNIDGSINSGAYVNDLIAFT